MHTSLNRTDYVCSLDSEGEEGLEGCWGAREDTADQVVLSVR